LFVDGNRSGMKPSFLYEFCSSWKSVHWTNLGKSVPFFINVQGLGCINFLNIFHKRIWKLFKGWKPFMLLVFFGSWCKFGDRTIFMFLCFGSSWKSGHENSSWFAFIYVKGGICFSFYENAQVGTAFIFKTVHAWGFRT
jgi:hypothetical protein